MEGDGTIIRQGSRQWQLKWGGGERLDWEDVQTELL